MSSLFSSKFFIVIATISSIALGFLGVLFLLASAMNLNRLMVGIILIMIALVLAIFIFRSTVKPPPITVYWKPSGKVKLEELKCPSCGAPLNVENPSVSRVVCQYCSKAIEITEEPQW